MPSIYKYIIFSSILLLLPIANSTAQKTTEKNDTTNQWQGINTEIDIAPILSKLWSQSHTNTYQAMIQANISNKYFPVIELGWANTHKVINGTTFQTQSYFGRVGIDFNLLKSKNSKEKINNYLLAGVRLAANPFEYNISNLKITNPYWGGEQVIHKNGIKAIKLWLELNIGVRVAIYQNIYMGWNIRNKRLIGKTTEGELTPWYIPGYGINNSSNWGMNYIIGYRF